MGFLHKRDESNDSTSLQPSEDPILISHTPNSSEARVSKPPETNNSKPSSIPEGRLQPLTPPTRSRSARGSSRRHRVYRTSYRSFGGGSESEEEEENENGGRKRPSLKRDRHSVKGDLEDSDDEVVRLCNSRGSKLLDPLGREQPFPAMVNREMLCSMVRRAFNQTEEQQIQYEQMLRHENGRKSKGEVRKRETERERERD